MPTRALLFSTTAFIALPALAQTPPATTARPQQERAAASPAGLEEILVTARRRVESIQDTPVAVSAISPSTLANAAAPDIRDLVGRTPNLVIDPVNAGPSAAAISIRGISFEDIEKSFDPAVGVLIDGVYLGTNTGQLLDFFDFERVEVLRGPQGTLFGRNTTAGVINIQRSRPTGELGARIQGTFGNYDRRDLRTVFNLPKIGDVLSLKGFWLHNEGGGYYDNVTLNARRGNRNYDNYGVTALLEIGDFDATVTYERVNEDTEIDQAPLSATGLDVICLPLPLPPGLLSPRSQCDRNTKDDMYTTFTNVPGRAKNDGDNVTINANWRLGGVTLTSVTGWRSSRESVRQDFDSSSINFFDTLRLQTYRQFSQELRAAGDVADRVDYVVGGYYFNSNYTLDQSTFFGPFLQIPAPAGPGLPPQTGNRVNHTGKSAAVFADFNILITDELRLSVGGRYTWDKKRYTNDLFKTGIPALIATPEVSWKQFTPRASIDYRISPGNLVYASYARGYRAGGLNGRAQTLTAANTPYGPEKVDSYELGVKSEFLDRRMTLNVAGFITKYKDKQEEVVRPAPPPAGQETVVVNAARATIKGLEAELRARATEGLNLNASLGLLDAKYDSFPTTVVLANGTILPVDASTRKLRRTPDVSASAGFDYTAPVGPGEVTLQGSWRYVSSYQTTIIPPAGNPGVNDPRGLAQSRNVIDASLAYTFEASGSKVRAAVFGRNLTDDRGLSASLPVAGLFTFGGARPPRTYGVEVGVEF